LKCYAGAVVVHSRLQDQSKKMRVLQKFHITAPAKSMQTDKICPHPPQNRKRKLIAKNVAVDYVCKANGSAHIHDVITHARFEISLRSLKGFRVGCGVRLKAQHFPLTLLIVLTTLLHYRVSVG